MWQEHVVSMTETFYDRNSMPSEIYFYVLFERKKFLWDLRVSLNLVSPALPCPALRVVAESWSKECSKWTLWAPLRPYLGQKVKKTKKFQCQLEDWIQCRAFLRNHFLSLVSKSLQKKFDEKIHLASRFHLILNLNIYPVHSMSSEEKKKSYYKLFIVHCSCHY